MRSRIARSSPRSPSRRRSPSPRRRCRRPPRAISPMLSTLTPPSTSRRMSRPLRVDDRARTARNFGSVDGNELLAAEARVHRHQQHHVELVEHVIEVVQRRGRIEHQSGLAAVFADQPDACGRRARWPPGWKRDVGRAGLGEIRNDAVDRLDHQVHVDRRGDAVLAQRLAHQRPDREVRHVVVVHHVEVDDVGAGGEHRCDFLAESREVGGQDRRRDPRRAVCFVVSRKPQLHAARGLAPVRRPPGSAACAPWRAASIDSGRPLAFSLSGMIAGSSAGGMPW